MNLTPEEAHAEAVRRIEAACEKKHIALNLARLNLVTLPPELEKLTALTALDMTLCSVTDLSPLSHLTELTLLVLMGCSEVSDLSPLSRLTKLSKLWMRGCSRVTDLTPLATLPALCGLELRGCRGVTRLAPIRPLLPRLQWLNLYDCNFSDLPSAIYSDYHKNHNVIDEVRAYYADLDAGAQADAEVKLFILGNGGVGKTQLRHRLCDPDYELDPSIPTTHGVELDRFATELDDKRSDVRVNLWDFGGQDIYHGSHALFLDGHAVFLILWHPDFEHGEFTDPHSGVRMSNRPLAYWLDYVRAQAGPDAVVLVVQARADDRTDDRPLPDIDRGELRMSELRVSSLTGRGLGAFREQIKEAVRDLLDARPPYQIGVGRAKVRERLREWIAEDQQRPAAQRSHRTITRDEFAALCTEVGGVSSADALLTFLHRSGSVFYRPGLFGDRVVLDQQWALNAIYTVFDRNGVLPALVNDGEFTRTTLARLVWQQYSAEEQELFLGMMRECDICFQIGERALPTGRESLYVAPELLTDDRDAIRRVLDQRVPPGEPAVTATAQFEFLHDGVLRSILARIGRNFGDRATYWKWGCFLCDGRTQSRAWIEAARGGPADGPGGGRVIVRVWGEHPDDVVAALTQVVNESAGRREPKWVTARADGRREADGAALRRGESAPPLVPVVPVDPRPVVAISYKHGNDEDEAGRARGAFVENLHATMEGWRYAVIRDVKELANGGLIRPFIRKIACTRRVVIVLTDGYLRSMYCMLELQAIFHRATTDPDTFQDSIVPCVLETDLDIFTEDGRDWWLRYWEDRLAAMRARPKKGPLGLSDIWHVEMLTQMIVPILECIAGMKTPPGYAALAADGFAAVRAMIDRPDRR